MAVQSDADPVTSTPSQWKAAGSSERANLASGWGTRPLVGYAEGYELGSE